MFAANDGFESGFVALYSQLETYCGKSIYDSTGQDAVFQRSVYYLFGIKIQI